MLRAGRRTYRELVGFGALTTVVYLVWIAMVHSSKFDVHPDALSWGAALDLTVTVPLAYWLLVVRRARASPRSIVAVVALSVLGARSLLPSGHAAFLPWVRFATVPLELAVIMLAVSRVRVARRASATHDTLDDDMLTQLQSTLAVILGNATAGRALGHEVATFYYAFGRQRTTAPNAESVTDTQFSAAPPFATAVFLALIGVIAVESAVLHLLVSQRSSSFAWILTGLSVYSAIWLLAFQRSTVLRLSVLRANALVLRVGLQCDATVPWDDIASVRTLTWRDVPARAAAYLNAAKPSTPNVLIQFHHPVRVEGPYGIPRTVTQVGMRLERPEEFVSLIAARVSI